MDGGLPSRAMALTRLRGASGPPGSSPLGPHVATGAFGEIATPYRPQRGLGSQLN